MSHTIGKYGKSLKSWPYLLGNEYQKHFIYTRPYGIIFKRALFCSYHI